MLRTLLSIVVAVSTVTTFAAEQPNVLIIMADDCTHNDLPLYGGQNAKTPNIDALAAQGLTFNKAYLCSAMCQPCRAELFTGQYPMNNGCAWNHSASRPNVKSMPQHLQQVGYRVGIAGKVHVKPDAVFPFQKVAGYDASCVRNPTKTNDTTGVREFMSDQKPFCLVVALVEPHVPWVMGDAAAYPPIKIKLPPNIADTPRTREDFGRYLAEITYMDGQVGELLATLEETGKAQDTLVLFTSEQGSQFPGCKWTNWDTGVHTALIARWPEKVAAGKRTDALVQYCDVLPTIMDLAGAETADHNFDGVSFRPVLEGATTGQRKFAYFMHNNLPEGPPYPVRSITDGSYRYIQNLTPDELYIEKHVMGTRGTGDLNNPYWDTWIWDTEQQTATYNLVKRYMLRPPEQLYHTAEDGYELNNLAADSTVADRKQLLEAELTNWMTQQGDPGIPQDSMDALKAARQQQHLYYPTSPPVTQ